MGSLNGDIMVIRNGRSTSQVSIYNYPEHLNPFYEDDQHKRLRFWKISKKDNDGRRNSFSIGNLKDMWAFKSFRMKKKSSTLGINKTSESPPTLRRDFAIDNGWNTIDSRLRGSNATSLNSDNFQRNATYRSSLQTLPTNNADRIGLNRNDGYRSTIQVTRSNLRYQPQNQQQQQRPQSTGVSQNRRSSQSSMVSTNPFESDDDENEDINSSGIRSVNCGSTTTLTSRTPRKKRRAPAPPTPIHNRNNAAPPPIILIESSHDSTNDELHIREDMDIANLTAEIQNFVETTNNDDVEIIQEHKENRLITENVKVKDEDNINSKITNSVTSEQHKTNDITSTAVNLAQSNENSKDSSNNNNSIEDNIVSTTHKPNGNITTEVVTLATTTTTTSTSTPSSIDDHKPLEQESNSTKVTKIVEVKTDESKEITTNGAIPKKPNKVTDTIVSIDQQQSIDVVNDLCIKENKIENIQQKPVPLKRQTKAESEVGNVECVHVHVASPKATPRKEYQSGVSSFKTSKSIEKNETITTKTPFVLTSPPAHKKEIQPQVAYTSANKETVKIIKSTNENERINELNINEDRTNTKPEVLMKPTLSPKPVLKQDNIKAHGYAEIHKPMRSKYSSNQNGHVRRISRDENVSPPTLPLEKPKQVEDEEKIINSITVTQTETTEMKSKEQEENQLKIVENENNDNQHIKTESKTSAKSAKDHFKRDDEFEFLYRPQPASHMEWKRSTLAPLETNIPPEKRKSVKDIIESINRSQRLLSAAANKDFTTLSNTTITVNSSNDNPDGFTSIQTVKTTETNNTKNDFNEDLRILDERQKEIQRMVNEIDETNDVTAVSLSPSPSPSNYNNEIADAQKLDNNEIFQKCKVKKEVYDYRESSPISSNLDWNPLPKPKRTKPGND